MPSLNGFNASDVEPTTPYEPLPAGKYLAMITDTQNTPTKNGDGDYLQTELTVLEGAYQGRKVWDRLCLNHPNNETVRIARGNLSAICRAVNVMKPRDSVELHNHPLVITVKLKNRKDTGELGNEVKGYEAKAVAAGQPTQAPVDSNTPPWKR